MTIIEGLKNEFPLIKADVSLREYSTFRIGGNAKFLLKVSDKKDLKRIIEKANNINLPFLVIGGGSNILFSSKGYDGIIIVYKQDKLINSIVNKNNIINVDANIPLSVLISETKLLSGLEWAVGIPGTLAGAINGNAGAFGESISDIIKSVNVLELKKGKLIEKKYNKDDCHFSYRNSVFKNNNNLIILSAEIQMNSGNKEEIEKRIRGNLNKRSLKQPKGFSVGSIFKNGNDFSAGLLIEKAGLKGMKIGDAKISEEHANFIINLGNASSDDVLNLIKIIKKEVKEKFSIDLEEEIKIFN